MTEIYHGPWSPTKGDVKEVKQDEYHSYPVSKQETYQAKEVNYAGSVQESGK